MIVKDGKVSDYDLRSFYENQKIKYIFILEIDENYEFKVFLNQEDYSKFVGKILRGFDVNQMLDIVEKQVSFEVDDFDNITKLILLNNIELEINSTN